MSSGVTCPSCGVAVVPGYVKCPKCHRPLPRTPARRGGRSTADPGGTALDRPASFPIAPALFAVAVVGAIVAYLALRDRGGDKASADPGPAPTPGATARGPEPAAPSATPTPIAPVRADPPAPPHDGSPSPDALAAELDRTLKRARLWSTVSVIGRRVEIRSASCADPALAPIVDNAIAGLRAAGVAKLRCVDRGGAFVFERDL